MKNKYNFYTPNDSFGTAISYTIIDEDGKMWVGNGEYESQVNFCPMTGKKAPTQLKVAEVWENGTEKYENEI